MILAARVVSLALISAALLTEQDTRPQEAGEIPRAATAVINSVMSPYCPGLLLANCPSPAADSLRRAIVQRAARGATEDALRADLVATYGEVVRASPRTRGFGLVAWLVPFVLLVAVGALVLRWLQGRRDETSAAAQAVVPAIVDRDDVDRLRRLDELVRRP